MRALDKYLLHYAERDIDCAKTVTGIYNEAVILPLCGEDLFVDDLLQSVSTAAASVQKQVLAILVLNESPETQPEYRESNGRLLHRLGAQSFIRWSNRVDLLVVDRVSNPLPEKQGVGLARKIGADIAIQLLKEDKLTSSWIHTTDGDARVSQDYFVDDDSPDLKGLVFNSVGAEIYPYVHEGEGELAQAHTQYDEWMGSYVTGLRESGSPYAFPTIGSTLKFHADAYVSVRGFPRRNAAEDFYFLNKIAKISAIRMRRIGKVLLRARHSARVPFGTGRGVKRILEHDPSFAPYPEVIFPFLREAYEKADRALENKASSQIELDKYPPPFIQALEDNGFFVAIDEARERKTIKDRQLHFHRNFDAFRVLKTANSLRAALSSSPGI